MQALLIALQSNFFNKITLIFIFPHIFYLAIYHEQELIVKTNLIEHIRKMKFTL